MRQALFVAFSNEIVAETERLVIRPWRLEEADRLFDLLGRTKVVRWLGRPACPMMQLDEAVSRIERWATELATDPRSGPGRRSSAHRESRLARCC